MIVAKMSRTSRVRLGRLVRFPMRVIRYVLRPVVRRVDGRLHASQYRLADLEQAMTVGHQSLADLVALQAAAVRDLQVEMAHTARLVEASAPVDRSTGPERREGGARLSSLTEHIVETPFALAALADLPRRARVLDVGGGESTRALTLASLGYRCTIIDARGYPFDHPDLEVVEADLDRYQPSESFDAVMSLSSLERVGIGHAGDREAVVRLAGMLAPGGRLVLSARYGAATVADVQRIHDRVGIERLLDGWELQRVRVLRRGDADTWVSVADELVDPDEAPHVVMVLAKPGTDR